MRHQDSDGLSQVLRWRTFLAVHRTGSLTAAATVLGASQPTVTAQLQSLEAALGEKLFERRPRGVEPTPRADEIAAALGGPMDAVAEAIGRLDGTVATRSVVRMGGPAELMAEVATPALAPLVADGVRVHVTTGLADDLLEQLRAGGLDVVVASTRPRGRTLAVTPLTDETFVLVASPSLGIDPADVASRGASALDDVPLLAYAHDVPILRRYWRHVFGSRLVVAPALVLPDLRALARAAVEGAGVTVLPTYLVDAALETGTLVALVETDDPPINTLYLAQRPGVVGDDVRRVRAALEGAVSHW